MDKKILVTIMCCVLAIILLVVIPSTNAINNKNLTIKECESYHSLKKCTIENYSPYCYENNGYYNLYLYYYTNNSKSHVCISEGICENESKDIFFIALTALKFDRIVALGKPSQYPSLLLLII